MPPREMVTYNFITFAFVRKLRIFFVSPSIYTLIMNIYTFDMGAIYSFRRGAVRSAALFLLLLLLCLPHFSASAALVPCRGYDVRDGLSENSVRSIIQDSQGYIWLGTKDGLSRYNGREFKVWGSSSDEISLNVEFLLEHADGDKIWIASRYSLSLLDTDSGRLSSLSLASGGLTRGFRALCYDAEGRLWVGSNEGLAVIGKGSYADASLYSVEAVFKHSDSDPRSLPSDNVGAVLCDRSGKVWVGTENGLVRYDGEGGFIGVKTGDGARREHFMCLREDENGIIWAGTWDDGLYSINPADGSVHNFLSPHRSSTPVPLIRQMWHNGGSTIVLCANSGLFEYDRREGTLRRLILSEGLPNDSFYSCIKDNEGGLWIGTYFNGVFYVSPRAAEIELYRADPSGLFSGTAVSGFCESGPDRLWVGTENGGLSLLDRRSGEFIPTRWHDSGDNIHAIQQVGQDLWVATFSSGLKRINLSTGTVRYYYMTPGNRPDAENAVYSLYYNEKDGAGKLYVGTKRGCSVFDYASGVMTPIPELDSHIIYDILEDYTGKLWFGSLEDGLFCCDKNSGAWKRYVHDPSDPGSLCSDRVIGIHSDRRGQLWFCTEGSGVCRYDYASDSFAAPKVNTPDGKLPCNVIFGLLDDAEGRLWMSSNSGLIRLDPQSGECRLYTHEDGLQSNQFNFKAVYRTSDGKFWWGGVNGFNAFRPEDIRDNAVAPRVTASLRYADSVVTGSELSVPSGVKNFSIDFDCLSYVSPQKTVFEYRFSKDPLWTRTSQPSVSFSDLTPGRYTFLLRAVNSDGLVSRENFTMALRINAPWYRTGLALGIYAAFLVLVISLGIHYFIRFKGRESRRRMEEMKLRSEQESYNAKIQFFTQIAHEIKTPVTLIKAPLEIVLEHKAWDKETEENLGIIEANTSRLSELTNQLLDFKKVSNEGYLLHTEPVNIVAVTEEVIGRFKKPSGKAVALRYAGPEAITGMFDPDALSKILSNLIENAVKYTRDSIEVRWETARKDGADTVRLSVTNNGPAIPPEEAVKIFDTFYQIDSGDSRARKPGFGIGLSLVSLLVDKSGGRVWVDNTYTEGCRFCVELPWKQAEAPAEASEKNSATEESESAGMATILVVEDNTDILSFIADQMKGSYRVLKATDGQKALARLEKNNVDIVVSDLAMPNMDGFELLKQIRENPMTSHIPFVILSAESSVESKIRGLDCGADAYIEKPFSINHFRAVVENILSSRKALMEKFASSPDESLNLLKYGALDTEWLGKVDQIINANISSLEFSVQQLADEMFVSRSNLQRKMKSLTGMSPNEYVRLVRLKKAAELLLSDNYRINEVCYMCGFNTPSYFTSCFFKQFGILPKEFIALHKEEVK